MATNWPILFLSLSPVIDLIEFLSAFSYSSTIGTAAAEVGKYKFPKALSDNAK